MIGWLFCLCFFLFSTIVYLLQRFFIDFLAGILDHFDAVSGAFGNGFLDLNMVT